eukprot:51458-Chlamydomonas_euryale.AAC.9
MGSEEGARDAAAAAAAGRRYQQRKRKQRRRGGEWQCRRRGSWREGRCRSRGRRRQGGAARSTDCGPGMHCDCDRRDRPCASANPSSGARCSSCRGRGRARRRRVVAAARPRRQSAGARGRASAAPPRAVDAAFGRPRAVAAARGRHVPTLVAQQRRRGREQRDGHPRGRRGAVLQHALQHALSVVKGAHAEKGRSEATGDRGVGEAREWRKNLALGIKGREEEPVLLDSHSQDVSQQSAPGAAVVLRER